MSVFVKICGLKNADDVAAAVLAGADAVGFVFAESVRQVTPRQASEACEAAPPDIRRVAVMLHPSNEAWLDVLDVFEPDVLQTDIEDFAGLEVPDSIQRWPVVREAAGVADDALPATFVYEGQVSGAGQKVDFERAADVAQKGRMILAGGLDADCVAQAIEIVQPFGVDVSSGVESAPGVKDPRRIQQFVNAARAVEKSL